MKTKDFIKKKRQSLGMTMKQLAEKVGVSEATISRWESGNIGNMRRDNLNALIAALNVTPEEILFDWEDMPDLEPTALGRRIPVYGRVAAGIPIEAVENIVDYEEIPASWTGDYAALVVRGDSMSPRILDGDVLIVKRQDDAESGDIVVAMVNGEDATVKRLIKYTDGIMLQALNPAYEPMYFSKENKESIPVTIWGKVVELRGKI